MMQGEAHLENQFTQPKASLASLKKFDMFGMSKFLNIQSYSYFGDVIAGTPLVQKLSQDSKTGNSNQVKKFDESAIIKSKNTKCQKESVKSSTSDPKETSNVTCMFLPMEDIYLIPFYDWQRLRTVNFKDDKLLKLRKQCFNEFKAPIKKFKQKLLENL